MPEAAPERPWKDRGRNDKRKFPMQGDDLGAPGEIPWELAELVYAAYKADGHGSQSLERLAERGGFSWQEIVMLLRGPKHYRMGHKCDPQCWSIPS